MSSSFKERLSCMFPDEDIFRCFSTLPCVLHIPPTLSEDSSNIWRGVEIMKLLVRYSYFYSSSGTNILLNSQYSTAVSLCYFP
jgi:hypothetical protein